MDPNKVLQKMMASCARKEYCSSEIREKLRRFELDPEAKEGILAKLIEQKFIDNERFVKAYVRDKSEFNKWGKTKIRYQLQAKKIEAHLITAALDSLDAELYEQQLDELLYKKIKQLMPIDDKWQVKSKLVRFAASRGFEPDMIYRRVDYVMDHLSD